MPAIIFSIILSLRLLFDDAVYAATQRRAAHAHAQRVI